MHSPGDTFPPSASILESFRVKSSEVRDLSFSETRLCEARPRSNRPSKSGTGVEARPAANERIGARVKERGEENRESPDRYSRWDSPIHSSPAGCETPEERKT